MFFISFKFKNMMSLIHIFFFNRHCNNKAQSISKMNKTVRLFCYFKYSSAIFHGIVDVIVPKA